MEDFILGEINKIGQLIQGLLKKMGLGKNSVEKQAILQPTKTELAENLQFDFNELLEDDRFIQRLISEHGFNHHNLEQFAELLADMAAASETPKEQCWLAAAACEIYKYQDAHKAPASLNRYYILKELSKYNL